MKTTELIKLFKNKAAIAKALGISRAAVTTWGDEVPELRVFQLKEKFPHLFDPKKKQA